MTIHGALNWAPSFGCIISILRYHGDKGKAWDAVKKRTREKETDCYTCPLKDLIANGYKADAGHYKPVALVGSNNQLSWDEHFIHLQCSRCNGSGQGMAVEYRAHLVRDYGEDLVAKFDATWRQVNPVKNWKAIIEAPQCALQLPCGSLNSSKVA